MALQIGAFGRSTALLQPFGQPVSRRFLDRAYGMVGLPPLGRLGSLIGSRIGLFETVVRRPFRACDYGYRRNAVLSSFGVLSLGVRHPAFMAAFTRDGAPIRATVARQIFGADPPADYFFHPVGTYSQR